MREMCDDIWLQMTVYGINVNFSYGVRMRIFDKKAAKKHIDRKCEEIILVFD